MGLNLFTLVYGKVDSQQPSSGGPYRYSVPGENPPVTFLFPKVFFNWTAKFPLLKYIYQTYQTPIGVIIREQQYWFRMVFFFLKLDFGRFLFSWQTQTFSSGRVLSCWFLVFPFLRIRRGGFDPPSFKIGLFDSCQNFAHHFLLTGKLKGGPYKKKRPEISSSENEIPAKGQRIPVLLLID